MAEAPLDWASGLPTDVLWDIFQNVGAPGILHCAATCKAWRGLLTTEHGILGTLEIDLRRGSSGKIKLNGRQLLALDAPAGNPPHPPGLNGLMDPQSHATSVKLGRSLDGFLAWLRPRIRAGALQRVVIYSDGSRGEREAIPSEAALAAAGPGAGPQQALRGAVSMGTRKARLERGTLEAFIGTQESSKRTRLEYRTTVGTMVRRGWTMLSLGLTVDRLHLNGLMTRDAEDAAFCDALAGSSLNPGVPMARRLLVSTRAVLAAPTPTDPVPTPIVPLLPKLKIIEGLRLVLGAKTAAVPAEVLSTSKAEGGILQALELLRIHEGGAATSALDTVKSLRNTLKDLGLQFVKKLPATRDLAAALLAQPHLESLHLAIGSVSRRAPGQPPSLEALLGLTYADRSAELDLDPYWGIGTLPIPPSPSAYLSKPAAFTSLRSLSLSTLRGEAMWADLVTSVVPHLKTLESLSVVVHVTGKKPDAPQGPATGAQAAAFHFGAPGGFPPGFDPFFNLGPPPMGPGGQGGQTQVLGPFIIGANVNVGPGAAPGAAGNDIQSQVQNIGAMIGKHILGALFPGAQVAQGQPGAAAGPGAGAAAATVGANPAAAAGAGAAAAAAAGPAGAAAPAAGQAAAAGVPGGHSFIQVEMGGLPAGLFAGMIPPHLTGAAGAAQQAAAGQATAAQPQPQGQASQQAAAEEEEEGEGHQGQEGHVEEVEAGGNEDGDNYHEELDGEEEDMEWPPEDVMMQQYAVGAIEGLLGAGGGLTAADMEAMAAGAALGNQIVAHAFAAAEPGLGVPHAHPHQQAPHAPAHATGAHPGGSAGKSRASRALVKPGPGEDRPLIGFIGCPVPHRGLKHLSLQVRTQYGAHVDLSEVAEGFPRLTEAELYVVRQVEESGDERTPLSLALPRNLAANPHLERFLAPLGLMDALTLPSTLPSSWSQEVCVPPLQAADVGPGRPTCLVFGPGEARQPDGSWRSSFGYTGPIPANGAFAWPTASLGQTITLFDRAKNRPPPGLFPDNLPEHFRRCFVRAGLRMLPRSPMLFHSDGYNTTRLGIPSFSDGHRAAQRLGYRRFFEAERM